MPSCALAVSLLLPVEPGHGLFAYLHHDEGAAGDGDDQQPLAQIQAGGAKDRLQEGNVEDRRL
jgi:hypothetical protein